MIDAMDSEAFEQQIHQIHELLEDAGADVTWDDRIPDPDNPSQPRQIDVTIRRDGKLTLVECRHRRSPQDVTWIEELMGRRISLKADMTIAVSSSGFSAGALQKAKRYGIICRDLRELTDLEIEAWGRRVALTLYFYEYSDLQVSLCFEKESIPRLKIDLVTAELSRHPGIQLLFNAAAKQLGTLNMVGDERVGQPVTFGFRLQLDRFQISGEPIIEVGFSGNARLISKEIVSEAVLAYREPGELRQEPIVENFVLGKTSIVHDGHRISVFLDITDVKMPPFCQFRFFRLTGHEEMEHEAIEFVGIDKLWVHGKMSVNLCSR